MMRILTLIILLLFQGISLYASAGGALLTDEIPTVKSSEELTALWEKDSDAKLWGEKVLSGLRNRDENNFSLNAYCSPESIEKIIKLREFAAEIITASDTNAGEVYIAGNILEMTAAVSFTPLTICEKMLVSESFKSGMSSTDFSHRDFSSEKIPVPDFAVSPLFFSFTISSVNKLKTHKDKNRVINSYPAAIICVKNLFDMEFADLYRLFLYVRDNSGNGSSCYITYSSFPLHSSQFQNISTSNNITSENLIPQPGASS